MNFLNRWVSTKPGDVETPPSNTTQSNMYSKASKFLKKAFSSFSEAPPADDSNPQTLEISPFDISCRRDSSVCTSFENLNVSFASRPTSRSSDECECHPHISRINDIARVHSVRSLEDQELEGKRLPMRSSRSLDYDLSSSHFNSICAAHRPHDSFMPKLQIYGEPGNWWALNTNVLKIYQEYFQKNQLSSIKAEIVPLEKVPENLVKELAKNSRCKCQPLENDPSAEDKSRSSISNRLSSLFKPLVSDKTNSSPIGSYLEMYSRDIGLTLGSSPYEDFSSDSSSEDSREIDLEDDYPDEEWSVCYVCDREFTSPDQLFSHQMKRKHFWCDQCDTSYPSLLELEAHKSENGHMTDDDDDVIGMGFYEDEAVPITLASFRQSKDDQDFSNEEEKEKLLQ